MPPNKGPVKKASKPTYVKTRGGKVLNKNPRKVTRATSPTGPRGNTGPTGPKGKTDSTGRKTRPVAGVKAKGEVKIRPRQKYGKDWYKKVKKTATAGPAPLEMPLPHVLKKPVRTDTAEPVLKVLTQFNRPISGVTRGILEGSKRGNPVDAVKGMAKGVVENKNSTADIYRKLGASRKLSAVLGLPTDVVLDPTSWATLGGATAARHAATAGAEAAAVKTLKQAAKAGVKEESKGVAPKLARDAAKTARRQAKKQEIASVPEYASVERAVRQGGKATTPKAKVRTAKQTAQAQKQAAERANSGGYSTNPQQNLSRIKARQTAKEGARDQSVILEARFAGRRIAKKKIITGRGVTGLAPKEASKSSDVVRRGVSHVRPTLRPTSSADRAQFAKAQHERALGRAINNNSFADAQHTGEQLAKQLKSPRDQARVAHAVDTGDLARLPGSYAEEGSLYRVAVDMRSHLRRHNRLRARTPGVNQGTIYDYFPHMKESSIRKGKASDPMETAQAQVDAAANPIRPGRPSTTLKRKDRRTLAQKNTERTGVQVIRSKDGAITVTKHAPKADKFSTDPAVVMGNYELQTGKLLEKGHEINTVRKLGRPVEIRAASNVGSKKSTRVLNVGPLKRNEVVVHIDNKRGVTALTSQQIDLLGRGITKRRTAGGGMEDVVPGWKAGAFRVVDKTALDEAMMPAPVNSSWFSRHFVHGWKSLATATPMFHFRNFIGDTERLYTLDPGIGKKIPRLYGESTQSLRYIRQTQGMIGKKSSALTRKTRADKEVVDLGKSGKVTMAQWTKELKDNGIVQIGQRGSELRDIGGGAKGVTKRAGKIRRGGRRVNEVLQDRENLTYVAGYKHFREKGLNPEEARRRTMDALYDYGHVTPTERKLRGSVFPFYTFQARTPPYYAKTAVQRPGKIAGIEHLRRNAGIYFGQDDRSLSKEPDYMQRAGGIPIGGGKWLSYGSPAAQGLNELPGVLPPKEQLKEWARYGIGSMGWWAKMFPEAGPMVFDESNGGYNYFFGSPVQSPYGPLVPAPGLPWEKMGPALRKKLGVYEFTEKKSGKKVWGWKGWKQYALNTVTPGTPGFALRIGQEITQRGQSRGQQALNFATGLKVDNSNVYGALISKSYEERSALELKNNELRQRGMQESKQYQKNAKDIAELTNLIAEAGRLRGDKQTAKKGRKSSNPYLGGGSSSGGGKSSNPYLGGSSSSSSSESNPYLGR